MTLLLTAVSVWVTLIGLIVWLHWPIKLTDED